MVSISLCMIVKNEEAALARCLDSVRDAVDEIVIVDTGSTDRTKEIAANYTDRIYDFPWSDDFSAARNAAFSRAVMDYQMWLDADDVMTPENRDKLIALKRTLSPDVDIVTMRYVLQRDAQGRVLFQSMRERLLRRQAGFVWQDPVHEFIQMRGAILHSDIAVEHKKERSGALSQRNLRIYEARERRGDPFSPRQLYYFGRELFDHRLYDRARDCFERFLAAGESYAEDCINCCRSLAACYENAGAGDRAVSALIRSFSYDAPRAEACVALGYLYKNCGDDARAVRWFETATALVPPEQFAFFQADYWGYIPHMELAVLYYRLRQTEKAAFHNGEALRIKPDDPAALANQRFFNSVPPPKK